MPNAATKWPVVSYCDNSTTCSSLRWEMPRVFHRREHASISPFLVRIYLQHMSLKACCFTLITICVYTPLCQIGITLHEDCISLLIEVCYLIFCICGTSNSPSIPDCRMRNDLRRDMLSSFKRQLGIPSSSISNQLPESTDGSNLSGWVLRRKKAWEETRTDSNVRTVWSVYVYPSSRRSLDKVGVRDAEPWKSGAEKTMLIKVWVFPYSEREINARDLCMYINTARANLSSNH